MLNTHGGKCLFDKELHLVEVEHSVFIDVVDFPHLFDDRVYIFFSLSQAFEFTYQILFLLGHSSLNLRLSLLFDKVIFLDDEFPFLREALLEFETTRAAAS